ncbi:EamA family transporter, partial [Halobium palmae]
MSRFTPRGRHVAVFAFLAVAWGGSFVGMKIGLDAGIPPILYAALRFDVGAAVLLPTVLFLTDGQRRPRGREDWLYVLVAGAVIVAAANVFLFLGQQRTTSAVSSVVFSLNPVLAAGFAWLLLADEEPSLVRL